MRSKGISMQVDKDFLNLAKIYRSIGNAAGASLISLAAYFGSSYLLMLFPIPYEYDSLALWGVYIFLTLALGSTYIAFTCILIVQLHKTSKNQGVSLLDKHVRFWITSLCIGITIMTWSCIWFFLAIYYRYDHHGMVYLRLWPYMPSTVETWIKIMLALIPAICIALVYYPIAWKQYYKLKPIFLPARSKWFPSSGDEGIKWSTIALKLGLIAAASAVFIPVFITYQMFRGSSSLGTTLFPFMLTVIVVVSVSLCAHGFAGVVANAKGQFKLARGFMDMYRVQAGLPPIPDGYRLPPGLLTRSAFFSKRDDEVNPDSFKGIRSKSARSSGAIRGGREDAMNSSTGYYPESSGVCGSAEPDTPRSWLIPPSEINANSYPTPQVKPPSAQGWSTSREKPMTAPPSIPQPPTQVSPISNPEPPMQVSPTVSNPEPTAYGNDTPAIPEPTPSRDEGVPAEEKPPAQKALVGGDELKLDFADGQSP